MRFSPFTKSKAAEVAQEAQLPSAAVREAIAAGISSRSAIASRTGLRRETVDIIIERLERSGALRREALGGMCSGGGCSSCEHSTGGACAGSVSQNTGPVALVLTRRQI